MIKLQIRENLNADLGKTVYTIERKDGQMLMPADGIQSLNYSSRTLAEAVLPVIQNAIDNGQGQ